MDETKSGRVSHLFLVRLWLDRALDETDDNARNWRGKVQHVITGRAGDFSSRSSMVELLGSMLSLSELEGDDGSRQPGITGPSAQGPHEESRRTGAKG
ncbi:MAG: hypothetical protein M3014_10830 [Chloroflexota bacterium]|nr:hypothetical protein [Chloroflexota bacterium]